MKQMITVAGGVFFAVGIMFLILASGSLWDKIQFENELQSRGEWNKTLSKVSGLEDFKKQDLQKKHDLMVALFVISGISSSIGLSLAIAGRSKSAQ